MCCPALSVRVLGRRPLCFLVHRSLLLPYILRTQQVGLMSASFLPLLSARWNCIVTTHGPPPMAGHSSCVIGDKMIVFGGSLGSRQM